MTAGYGNTHAEQSPEQYGRYPHGVPLWNTLPAGDHDSAALRKRTLTCRSNANRAARSPYSWASLAR